MRYGWEVPALTVLLLGVVSGILFLVTQHTDIFLRATQTEILCAFLCAVFAFSGLGKVKVGEINKPGWLWLLQVFGIIFGMFIVLSFEWRVFALTSFAGPIPLADPFTHDFSLWWWAGMTTWPLFLWVGGFLYLKKHGITKPLYSFIHFVFLQRLHRFVAIGGHATQAMIATLGIQLLFAAIWIGLLQYLAAFAELPLKAYLVLFSLSCAFLMLGVVQYFYKQQRKKWARLDRTFRYLFLWATFWLQGLLLGVCVGIKPLVMDNLTRYMEHWDLVQRLFDNLLPDAGSMQICLYWSLYLLICPWVASLLVRVSEGRSWLSIFMVTAIPCFLIEFFGFPFLLLAQTMWPLVGIAFAVGVVCLGFGSYSTGIFQSYWLPTHAKGPHISQVAATLLSGSLTMMLYYGLGGGRIIAVYISSVAAISMLFVLTMLAGLFLALAQKKHAITLKTQVNYMS